MKRREDGATPRDEDVFRIHVAMEDPGGMSMTDGFRRIPEDPAETRGLADLGLAQRLGVHEVGRDIQPALTPSGALHLKDVRMGKPHERLHAFLEVTLPLSLPGILAGSLLVFALAISAYVTPVLLGGNNVLTLPMLIYQQVSSSFNLGFAGALGVVLLAVSLALVFAYNTILSRLTGERQIA